MSQTRFSVLIHQQAKKYGDRVALKHRDYKTNMPWGTAPFCHYSTTAAGCGCRGYGDSAFWE